MRGFDYLQYQQLRQKALESKNLDQEFLATFRKSITKVSLEELKKIGDELLQLISSNPYIKQQDIQKATTLVFNGADLETKDNKGNTGLLLCTKNNLHDTFLLYVRAGANLNAQNNYATTACMWSARKGHDTILYDLILLGADINLQCSDGDNALISATRHNSYTSVKMLIEANAILNLQNNNGEEALSIAIAKGYTEIAKLISSALESSKRIEEQIQGCSSDEIQQGLQLAKERVKSLTKL